MTIRLLLADGFALVRTALRQLLEFQPDKEIAGRTSRRQEQRRQFQVDCELPGRLGNSVKRMTGPFFATTGLVSDGGGNASIEAIVDLPKPCIAPAVFITGAGAWFTVTVQ